MLAAALLISIYNILQRGLFRGFGAIQMTAYSFFAGTLLLLPFLSKAAGQLRNAPGEQLALVFFLGVCPSAIAYLAWAKALSIAPKTSRVTNYMFLTPFPALIWDYFVSGELPGAGTFAGGGVDPCGPVSVRGFRKPENFDGINC